MTDIANSTEDEHDEDAEFFAGMPPEFFEELKRRAELARTRPGISVADLKRRVRREAREALRQT
ncbi:hypothetical protein O9X98_09750 [Agrobacterium salinitolerans]|nr:hypothetical protein [Agrobacterium salinitolerans]